ncbi:hypothetical protein KAR91_61855 [Candidatus Pacearchaeota archaeon]|nr:hypothetical protein [Candidatus Pacearchaeota archaeon]
MKQFALEDYLDDNNLFPASIGSNNELMNILFWTRDNYYIWLAMDGPIKDKMTEAFQGIFDYNKLFKKFDYIPKEEKHFINPLHTKNIQEIGGGWAFIQTDTYGNLLEIFSKTNDKSRSDTMLKYLEDITFWQRPDYGFWECFRAELHASSLAACLRGIQEYESNFGKTSNSEKIKYLGMGSLSAVLQKGEAHTREKDLATLSLLYPGNLPEEIITPEIKKKIISDVKDLEGEFGFKRYFNDIWDGKTQYDGCKNHPEFIQGTEMQWTLGLPWMALVTGDESYLKRTKAIKDKYGTLPEGFVPIDRNDLSKGWQPNGTPCLFWSEAMYKLAKKKFMKSE